MGQVLALILDAGEKRQFNVSTDTLKVANAVNASDAVAYGQLVDASSGSTLVVPITKNDYASSFVIPDTGGLTQPTRSAFSSTARMTLAGTGRETVFDPLNNPYGKGAFNQPSMIIRSGEFVQQYSRLIACGNERATFTEDGRMVLFTQLGTAGSIGQDATQKIGITQILGTSTNFLRADSAQALDQTIDLALTHAQSVTVTDTTANTITTALTIGHNSTNTPISGFGTGLVFNAKDSTTNDTTIAALKPVWRDATHGSANSCLEFYVMEPVSGVLTRCMQLTGFGGLALGNAVSTSNIAAGIINLAGGGGGIQFGSGVGAAGRFMQADSTKYAESTYALPTSAGTAGKLFQSNGSSIIASTSTWPTTITTSGQAVMSDGSNWVSGNVPPVTIDDYSVNFTIPTTANLSQPTRLTFASAERGTLAGTGRSTIFDLLNAPVVMYDKGALSPGSFLLRDQEFMLQNKRIAVVGNQRATMTETARFVGYDYPASCSRLILSGSSQNNN